MIEVNNLKKSFGNVQAVKDLSLKVKEGELFAFLGINGAGKSTTINIICGQLSKDEGTVYVDGKNVDKDINSIKRELGVVFQNSVLDKCLTVKDNLKIKASLYGIYGKEFENRLNELSEMLDFKDILNRRIDKLSGGQKRRIDIARALFHRPKILILDEPTTGLDPQTRKTLWGVLENLRHNEKMTILLTTHYMEESADADYVVIIDEGRKIAEGTPLELKNKYTGDFITLYNSTEEDVMKLGKEYKKIKDAYRIEVSDTAEATKLISMFPEIFNDYEVIKGNMDDVFLNATGKILKGGLK